jgi:hypothetical protein
MDCLAAAVYVCNPGFYLSVIYFSMYTQDSRETMV